MSDITQEDIIRILREKKAKAEMAKRHKQEEQEDVILGEDFLESFKVKKQTSQPVQEPEPIKEPIVEEEKPFFKSDILNKISKGDLSVLVP